MRTRGKHDRPAPLWLGVHEAAHAVARLVLNETLPYTGPLLQFVSVEQDGEVLGWSAARLRNPLIVAPRKDLDLDPSSLKFLPEMIRNTECDVIEHLAGPAAELRQRAGLMGMLISERDISCKVKAIDRLELTGSLLTDYHFVRFMLDWIDPADQEATFRQLWQRAVMLIDNEFPGIVEVARVLCVAGKMDGEEFERAWRERRPSEGTRLRRGKQLHRYTATSASWAAAWTTNHDTPGAVSFSAARRDG
jgi:hypothetical protein